MIEQKKYDLYGAQNSVITKVTNTYDKDNLRISYYVDEENPRCVFIGWISTNSPDYVNQRGIRVGCSEAELQENTRKLEILPYATILQNQTILFSLLSTPLQYLRLPM